MADLNKVLGLGVAGNFAGYLKQTGQEGDFAGVKVKEAQAPKGLFPYYVPNAEGYLGVFPYSSRRIAYPAEGNLQAEPELAILCQMDYQGEQVVKLTPTHFAAFNDCSIRKKGTAKLSMRKNWGADSVGCSDQFLALDQFSSGGALDNYRLACYVRRGGDFHAYAVDTPVLSYSYFYERLLDWTLERINYQPDQDPFEEVSQLLATANYPSQALICVGAPRYSDFGESTFLEKGDEVIVAVYDGAQYKPSEISEALKAGQSLTQGVSLLAQTVD